MSVITIGDMLKTHYDPNKTLINQRETDLLRFSLERRSHWYYVNAWGRTSRYAPWRQVWHNRCHISYLHALNEFNDTGAALADWKSLLSFA